jgi:hypothetical protein
MLEILFCFVSFRLHAKLSKLFCLFIQFEQKRSSFALISVVSHI